MRRHRWAKAGGWATCRECGCRYRTGMASRVYEHPGGRLSASAGECPGRADEKVVAPVSQPVLEG